MAAPTDKTPSSTSSPALDIAIEVAELDEQNIG